ncbi:MAG TPA: tripartite tricarboxylate transporter substrate binding protein [Burkholderiaceae bacterium]|nr:tripartite tricarboxylate transporter substrate binding protein [Burkholderiaceae bacterium]
MTTTRSLMRALVLLATGLSAAVGPAAAQTYPSKPIRMIVGYSPGGAVDLIARTLGQQLSNALGQPVIVENKPGAGTNVANRALIDSAPDGYTLMLAANAIAANPALFQPPPFDPLRDMTAVAIVGRVPVVLAAGTGANAPQSIAALIAQAKAKPNSVDFGTPGNGSTPHLAIELFERAAGIELLHVPYKGGAPAINDVLAGHVQTVAVNALEVLPHVKAGKLRVLAVLSPSRTPIFPDAPTIAESGFPGFEASVWYGVIGPAGLPAPVVQRLHAAVQKALDAPELRERLTSAGGEVLPGPQDRFSALLASEKARYEKLIRAAQIKPD